MQTIFQLSYCHESIARPILSGNTTKNCCNNPIISLVQINYDKKYDSTDRIVNHFEETLVQDVPLEVKNFSADTSLVVHQSDFFINRTPSLVIYINSNAC